jgi:hypothetical protein
MRGLPPAVAAALLVLLPATDLIAQSDADRRADSAMRRRDDLFQFEVGADTSGEETPPVTSANYPPTWDPEFSARFTRRDLLGLRDHPFFVTYDRADGLELRAGADLPRELFTERRLQGHVGVGYGFGSHYWQAAGGLRADFLSEETPLRIGAEGHIVTDTRDAWKMDPVENTLYAVIAGGDARDYFQRRGASVSIESFITPRTSIAAEYRYDRYRNSRREVDWSIFGPEHPFREVPSIVEGPMQSVAATFLADYMSLRSWSDPQFGVSAQAEFGWGEDRNVLTSSNDNVTYSFQSYIVDARLKTTIAPRTLFVALRLRAGAAVGDAPPQRLFTIGGVGTLPGYPQNEYTGNRLLLVQTELLVQPFASGVGRNIRIVLSNDVGAVSMADSTDRDNPLALGPASIGDWKYSPGIYIGSPAGHVLIGVAWRTDVMESPQFVMRFAQVF